MKANSRLKRKDYETHLRQLQAELCLLQDWVKHEGLRVIILFEGRDGAGKGGTIKHDVCDDDDATLLDRRFVPEKY